MSKIAFLLPILLFINQVVFSQELEQQYGNYSYSKVISFEDKDSTQLNDLLVKWFEETEDYSITLEKEESKGLSLDVINKNTTFYGKKYSELRFACKVSIKDNKAKFDISHMLIGDIEGKTVSVSETLYSSRKDRERTNSSALEMKEVLTNYIEEFLNKTSSYVEHDGKMEEDRW